MIFRNWVALLCTLGVLLAVHRAEDAVNDREAGIFGCLALAHELDNHEGRAVAHHVHADAGGACRAHFVVDIEPASEDG